MTKRKLWAWMKTHFWTFSMLAGIIAFLVYLGGAWFILMPESVWSPDAGAKFLQLQSLRLEGGRPACDIHYPGYHLDPNIRFASSDSASGLLVVLNGKLQFQRLPIFPLLTKPLFWWLGFRGLYLLPAVGGAISGVLALSLLRKRDRRFAMWVLMAFGSPIYIYAMLFWEHTLAVALGLAGTWLAFWLEASRPDASLLYRTVVWTGVGALLGISAYIRLEMLIFALALLLAYGVVVSHRRWGILWASVILGFVMLPYRPLHGILFSGQKMAGNTNYLFYPFAYLADAGWRVVPELLIGPYTGLSLDTGGLGILWAGMAATVVVQSLIAKDSIAERCVQVPGLVVLVIVSAIFLFAPRGYRSAHGLLFTTPWALLGLSRAREVWQRGDWRARVIVLTIMVGLLGYIMGLIGLRASSPHGGLEWGARFAMAFYPLLALIAAWDLGMNRRDSLTLILVGAFVFLGLGFQARGIWTIRHDKHFNALLNRVILEMPEPIVSDLGWMPLNAAPIYSQTSIFVTDTPEELRDWVNVAESHHLRRFSVVTLNRTLLDDADHLLSGRLEIVEARRVGNLLFFQVAIESERTGVNDLLLTCCFSLGSDYLK